MPCKVVVFPHSKAKQSLGIRHLLFNGVTERVFIAIVELHAAELLTVQHLLHGEPMVVSRFHFIHLLSSLGSWLHDV